MYIVILDNKVKYTAKKRLLKQDSSVYVQNENNPNNYYVSENMFKTSLNISNRFLILHFMREAWRHGVVTFYVITQISS